ncbi:putative B9 domain-containing protein 2 [Operophtera brumata]|uniref:Putative B9 domain-containing protein 2 n=1 Tax=Operophtera brumata TaxID=104452 RepID=A0A0L7LUQ8_OPEBR|nr:putative B9 domain-containing protein 2 [Operophtera brumata]
MAELHVLGHLKGATNFQDKSSLFCRYSFQHGPNWTVISGCPEGQTVAGKPDYSKSIIWTQPIDVHFVTRGIQGWPKLIFQVFCLDTFGRVWVVGYGVCSLPSVPGAHTIQVPCWTPSATTLTDRIRQYFLGGSHQLTQSDIIHLGADSVMDFIQSKLQLDERLTDATNATSRKRHLRDVVKDLNYKPHALYYRTQVKKLGKDAPANIYDNTSLPDLFTSSESTTAVFEILYDESTSATDDEIPFTTEAVYTSTEFDNVTEMFFFGKTNQTTIIPNFKQKNKGNKECKCSFLNCSTLHCVNWTHIICKNRICTNYNKSLHEPACTDTICANLALKLEYIFNYHDSKITNATIKFHIQNVQTDLNFMTQEIEVKFVLANESIDRVLRLSGNPGYIDNLPVILSYAESNYTDAFYNKSSQSKTYFTLPESHDGVCISPNLTERFILFGSNRRIKCRYNHKYLKHQNSTEQCKSIQKNIRSLLDLRNKIIVSPLGDPQYIKDKDWITLEMNVSDKTFLYGELHNKSSKLYCYNIITRSQINTSHIPLFLVMRRLTAIIES